MPTLRDIGGYLLDPMQAASDFARYTTGDLLFPMERHLASKNDQQRQYLQRAPSLASLGQRYQAPATFDERFGPFVAEPGTTEDQMIQRYLDQLRFRQTPEAIRPGTRTFPFGYTQI